MTQSMVIFAELGARDPFADFLNLVPTSLSNLEVSHTLESDGFAVCCYTEDAFPDDRAGVRSRHINVGTVILSIY